MTQNNIVPAVDEDYQYTTTSTKEASSTQGSDISVQYLDETGGTSVPLETIETQSGHLNTLPQGHLTTNEPLISTDALGNFTLMGIIETLIAYSFIIAGALSAVFIFIGGISFILSGGNDEKIKQAINTIRYSIIGLIITVLSFTFVIIVGRVFGLDFLRYVSFEKIRNDITKLLSPANNPQTEDFEIRS